MDILFLPTHRKCPFSTEKLILITEARGGTKKKSFLHSFPTFKGFLYLAIKTNPQTLRVVLSCGRYRSPSDRPLPFDLRENDKKLCVEDNFYPKRALHFPFWKNENPKRFLV